MKEQVISNGSINAAAESLSNLRDRTMKVSKAAAKVLDEQAHEKVWTFVGAAAAASLIGGYLIGRWRGGRLPLK